MTFVQILEQENYKTKFFPKGTIIFHEGDECCCVGLVKTGYIRIQSYSYAGSEIIYNEIKPNNFFGTHLVFSDDKRYKGSVIAIEDSEVFLLKKEQFQKLMQDNTEFFIEFMNKESVFVKSLNFKIKLLSFQSAEERFLFYLSSNGGEVHFKSITALAQTLHLERETLSRLISSLEKRRLIRRLSHQINLVN